ncbi:SWIM zinc finger domain-containing protein, partial [Thiocapsa sp.]|uniref:SWIM zinc finger family protein n=1 Tax=Thiocapsa sp. TaxID=2024551 RepID=UPI0035945BA8
MKHEIPPTYLERGRRYLQERRVLSVDHDAARGLVTGRVRGSGRRIYQCIVQIGAHADGAVSVVGQCSCPVGYNCKHVAAVLLSLGARPAGGAASGGAPVLPHPLSTWLDQVERATASPSEEAHRLVYILDLEEICGTTRTTIRAAKVRLLLTGDYGKPQDFNILGQSCAGFVAPEDQRIMALVAVGRGGGTGTSARLDDLTGADVMQAIARSGRGYFRTTDGPALRDAGPLDGRLIWRLGDDAQFRVVLEADRQGLLLLPMTPPWYLDPQSGDCGPLRTGLG